MSNQPLVFISSSLEDKLQMLAFKEQLEQRNLFVREGLELTPEEYEATDFSACILIVLLSPYALQDDNVQADIEFALEKKMKIVSVKIAECTPYNYLQNILPYQYQDFFSTQYDDFLKATGLYRLFNLQAAPPPTQTYESFPSISVPAPPASPKKSILGSLLDSINPFKKSTPKSIFDGMDNMVGSSGPATGSAARATSAKQPPQPTSVGAEPPENPTDFEPYQKIDTRPPTTSPDIFENLPKPSGIYIPHDRYFEDAAPMPQPEAAPVEAPGKGKVLYDIPDSMTVNQPQQCVVRVGKSEAIVLDDDSFSPAVKIETIPISKVMEVDMVDISDPPRFNIKKISAVEQLVEDDSYSEWIFMVTPLTGGVFPLLLKVSVIKIIDGKERRKELVFTRSINIIAAAMVTPEPTFIMPLVGLVPAAKPESTMKELLKEKDVKELDPPSVFISYAHLDKTYFDIFNQYLQIHSGWKIWTDRNIEIGSDWFQSIQSSIKDSDIAVLLISANFISSGFIKEHEFHQFSSLQSAKPNFKFLPVLLRDVDFTRWEDLAAMQLFVAYGDEYGVPDKKGIMIPFAKLCRFDNNSQLIPNDNIDTYFKNLVRKAEKDWLIAKT